MALLESLDRQHSPLLSPPPNDATRPILLPNRRHATSRHNPPPLSTTCHRRKPNQQRAELIGSLDYAARQRRIQSEQEMLRGQEDVTAALRRTRQAMAQSVEQQRGNLSVVGAGNAKLGGARDELRGQKEVFKKSHGLLGALKRQATMQW